MLEKIKSPKDIKDFDLEELDILTEEIREKIIQTVSENGGHLGSNLGLVETTVAIHRVFDIPKDTLIFDVGHQCYAHKLLTGREEAFSTLRTENGISGFTNRFESEYDAFTEGHSGTALSQALGIACAKEMADDDSYVIAVIGDGSFTNGMVYEALNNCRTMGKHLIIVLNDNDMSISKNVGGMSHHLTKIRTSDRYFNIKHRLKNNFSRHPKIGGRLNRFAVGFRNAMRRLLVSDNLFECMGIDYIGTVDGNDVEKMESVLKEAKTKNCCTLVHIHTKKGKGYAPSESNPGNYHSVAPFDVEKGVEFSSKRTFSSVFGDAVCALAEKDSGICAVTAAMCDGTGLSKFKSYHFDRFFDVGIAEEHAVTFAAGLAAGGSTPVVTVYSTFAQRIYDQIWHDIAIQGLPMTLCLDRAGLVEGDGITHQGIYDVSELSGIPGINIYSPETYSELVRIMAENIYGASADIIRYPKGAEREYDRSSFNDFGTCSLCHIKGHGKKITVFTYGRITENVYSACLKVNSECGCDITLIKLIKIFPLDCGFVIKATENSDFVYFCEEGIKTGGIGEKLCALLLENGVNTAAYVHGIEGFVPHSSLDRLMDRCGLTTEKIAAEIENLIEETENVCRSIDSEKEDLKVL